MSEEVKTINYVYLLLTREHLLLGHNIYKIGKTTQEGDKRFKQYPKDSVLLLQTICNNCHIIENIIKSEFKAKYKQRDDIGTEYFEGFYKDMILDIIKIIDDNDNLTLREIEQKKKDEIENKKRLKEEEKKFKEDIINKKKEDQIFKKEEEDKIKRYIEVLTISKKKNNISLFLEENIIKSSPCYFIKAIDLWELFKVCFSLNTDKSKKLIKKKYFLDKVKKELKVEIIDKFRPYEDGIQKCYSSIIFGYKLVIKNEEDDNIYN